MKLSEAQLETLLASYVASRADSRTWLYSDSRRSSVASAALEKKGLVTRFRDSLGIHIRNTKRGSRLLATTYPLETISLLAAFSLEPTPQRRAIRHMLLQLSPEQYPELLTSEVSVIRELAIRQWEVMQSETKRTSN